MENMYIDDFNFIYENMVKAKAQDRIDLLQLLIYPHTSKDKAQKIHKELVKQANAPEIMKERAVKTDDLKSIFGGKIEDVIKAKDGRK